MDQTTDIEKDTTSTFSVWVPGSNPSTTGNYLRLGSKDSAFESANLPNATGSELPDPGTLLYANGAVQIVAPEYNVTTTKWSTATLSESFSATYDGPLVASASWQAPHVASVSYQAMMEFNVNVTNTASLLVGNSLTYWAGNDASTGVGSLLWSNFGFTQNIFGGQIVNLINDSLDVQGHGEAKFISEYDLDAYESISLAVSPLAAASTSVANSFISKMNVIAGVLAVITGAVTVLGAGTTGWSLDVNETQDNIKEKMIVTMAEVATVETAVLILQALAITAGLVAKSAANAATSASTASIKIEDGHILIESGANYMSFSPGGITIGSPGGVLVEVGAGEFSTTAPAIQFNA